MARSNAQFPSQRLQWWAQDLLGTFASTLPCVWSFLAHKG